MTHTVAIPVCSGMTLLEYGAVIEALGFDWPDLPPLDYELLTCGPAEGVTAVGGAILLPQHPIDAIADADTVIVTGVTDPRRDRCPQWAPHLREASARGARIASVCTGAFALAEAGLLDGRRATTHWRHEALMRSAFPAVRLDASALVVRDGNIVTSAGASAGLDLCIRLIRDDHGSVRANHAAKRLVVTPHRPANQAQFADTDHLGADAADTFTSTLATVSEDIGSDWSVDELARAMNCSSRTLHRKFQQHTGHSPGAWVTRERIRRAMRLLEHTDHAVDVIARTVGFDSPETFRYHFRHITETSPRLYRNSFRESDRP